MSQILLVVLGVLLAAAASLLVLFNLPSTDLPSNVTASTELVQSQVDDANRMMGNLQ